MRSLHRRPEALYCTLFTQNFNAVKQTRSLLTSRYCDAYRMRGGTLLTSLLGGDTANSIFNRSR
jgi:hypothetical protein